MRDRLPAALALPLVALAACGGEAPGAASRCEVGCSWSAPERIGFGDAPSLGLAATGEGVVAWIGEGAQGPEIRAAARGLRTGWDAPRVLATGDGPDTSVTVGTASTGWSMVVWRRNEGEQVLIEAAAHDPVAGWGATEVVVRLVSSRVAYSVAVNDSGDALVGWSEIHEILTRLYRAGAGWQEEQTAQESTPILLSPRLTLGREGQMLGVWLRHPRYVVGPIQEYEVWYGTGAAGVWDLPRKARTGTVVGLGRLGRDGMGRAIVTATRSGSARTYGGISDRYEPGFGWESLDRPEAADFQDSFGALEVAEDGGAIARLGGSAVLFQPGAGWGRATPLPGLDRTSDVAMRRSGEAWTVWVAGGQLFASHYRQDSDWSAPVTLAGPGVCPEAHPDDPEVASDDRGRAAAVWAEREDCDAPREIRASLYGPTER